MGVICPGALKTGKDRKSTRLNSSHTEIYTLSLHDALPISAAALADALRAQSYAGDPVSVEVDGRDLPGGTKNWERSEEHTSELQSHRDLHSFPTRRSSDLRRRSGRRVARTVLRRRPRLRRGGWA